MKRSSLATTGMLDTLKARKHSGLVNLFLEPAVTVRASDDVPVWSRYNHSSPGSSFERKNFVFTMSFQWSRAISGLASIVMKTTVLGLPSSNHPERKCVSF
jgi:hypothetical protein